MRVLRFDWLRIRRPAVLLVLVLLMTSTAGLWTFLWAELDPPQAKDRRVARIVAQLMVDRHLSRRVMDDEISRRGFDSFLQTLDRMKLYFYQSDVDEFARQRTRLDDMVRSGDITFGYEVFTRYVQRIDERMKVIDELLASDLDFTADEEIVTDPKLLQYPQNEAEVRDRWRRRIKLDLLMLKLDDVEGKEARERLERRYHSFAKRMRQTDNDELLEMFLDSLTTSYDPHTSYMSPSSFENFNIIMRLNLEGIGAALQFQDGYTVVTSIIPGGAADKQGDLKEGDRVVAVGQGPGGEMVDVVDMKLGDVVNMIRGRAGTVVRLAVIPEGGNENKSIAITRAKIELKDSEARAEIVPQADPQGGAAVKIGFIDLPSFYMDMEAARRGNPNFKSTTRDVRRILEDFVAQRVDVVVLDLRRNGGGSLTEAINLTGLFIDYGPVVQVKDAEMGGARPEVQHYDDPDRGMVWGGPLVVLTSKFSASASEILAGAIQDYRRGLIVGDELTHGKGTVQSLIDLGEQLFHIPDPPNFGALKLTMQQFYRPNGDSTQKRGVLADISLPSFTSHMDVGEADLDYAMEFDKVPAAQYIAYNMVDPQLVNELRGRSAARLSQSKDFTDLQRKIARYDEQKERKATTLNEAKFEEQRKEFDSDKEEEKQLEEQNDSKDEVFQRNFYTEEVLAIARDYVGLLNRGVIARTN